MREFIRLHGMATLFAFLLPASLAAQHVTGTVREVGSGLPIEGALVVLVPPTGDSTRAGALTNGDGVYRLAGRVGSWRLRVDRIGHRSVYSDVFELQHGQEINVALEAPVQAIEMDALGIRTVSRGCALTPDEGLATARLWEEARKALETAYWSRKELVRFEAILHEGRLDPENLKVRSRRTVQRESRGARPFTTLTPEDLEAGGYVQPTDSGTYYFAPDESVLLSDVFLAGHCFRVRAAPDTRLVGLAFEPARVNSRVDIEGVLWLDRETQELRFLEYRYVNLDIDVPTEGIGGRVEFQRLPTGAWIARRWWIRMPVIQEKRTLTLGVPVVERELGAIMERGGEVVALETRDGGRIEALDRPRVQGVVYDSIHVKPLADARIFLIGTDRETWTDEDGRFTLSAGAGDYQLQYEHPVLDSAALQPDPVPIRMQPGVVHQVRLVVPSPQSVLADRCQRGQGRAVLVGSVQDAWGQPAPAAELRLVWHAGQEPGPIRRRSIPADGRGLFVFCDVPTDTELLARALHEGRSSPVRTLRLAPDSVVHLALRVDSLEVARIAGTVVDRQTGHRLPQASVRLRGTGLITLTNDDGAFSLEDVPPGTRVIEVAHLAYGTQRDSLAIEPGTTLLVDVAVSPGVIALEPLTVSAERRYRTPGLAGFYDRLDQRIGRYLTAEQIEARQSRSLSDVLRAVPGLTVACGTPSPTGSGCFIQFERARALAPSGQERACPIQYFLDGTRTAREIIEILQVQDIEGIEVYNGLSDVPPQFRRGPDTRCGVIAVWLKNRR